MYKFARYVPIAAREVAAGEDYYVCCRYCPIGVILREMRWRYVDMLPEGPEAVGALAGLLAGVGIDAPIREIRRSVYHFIDAWDRSLKDGGYGLDLYRALGVKAPATIQ